MDFFFPSDTVSPPYFTVLPFYALNKSSHNIITADLCVFSENLQRYREEEELSELPRHRVGQLVLLNKVSHAFIEA